MTAPDSRAVLRLTLEALVDKSDRALLALVRAHDRPGDAVQNIARAQTELFQALRALELARQAIEREGPRNVESPMPRRPRMSVVDRIATGVPTPLPDMELA